jgi:hypothetical protein
MLVGRRRHEVECHAADSLPLDDLAAILYASNVTPHTLARRTCTLIQAHCVVGREELPLQG